MINAVQIRAARAFLNWSTSDLAERAGMAANAINRIERGHVNAQRGTIEKLQDLFEAEGIEFLPSCGIRRKDNSITVFEGKGFQEELLKDITQTLKKKDNDLYIVHENNPLSTQENSFELLKNLSSNNKKSTINSKSLLSKQSDFPLPSTDSCHFLAEEYLSSSSLYIYGTKFALCTDIFSPKTLVINNIKIVESIKKIFDFVWDNAEIATKTKTPHKRAAGGKK